MSEATTKMYEATELVATEVFLAMVVAAFVGVIVMGVKIVRSEWND